MGYPPFPVAEPPPGPKPLGKRGKWGVSIFPSGYKNATPARPCDSPRVSVSTRCCNTALLVSARVAGPRFPTRRNSNPGTGDSSMNGKVIAFALVSGFVWVSSASAAISPGDGAAGNPPGEIFVTVWDAAGQISYTRDLGISVVDFIGNPSQSFSFAPDALYEETFGDV